VITSPLNTSEQAAQARDGFRICERMIAERALAEGVRLARALRPAAGARQLVRAGLHLGAYLRGRPGPWHA
jgi:hypothetical protein